MAPFIKLAELAERLAAEGSRIKKRAAIAEAIAAVEAETPGGEEAGLFALYMAGTPFAESDSRRLNAGGALLTTALLSVTGASDAALTAAYRRYGDLGAAGFELVEAQRPERRSQDAAGLTASEVAEVFAGMAVAKTTAARLAMVEGLLRRGSALEVKYLLKLMLGDMRIGVKQSLVEEAIAIAASGTPAPTPPRSTMSSTKSRHAETGAKETSPVSAAAVRNAVMLEADLAGAVRRAFDGTLGEARMRLFHPLGFMLASPVQSPEEAVARFTEKPLKVPKKGKTKSAADPSTAAAERAPVAQDDNQGDGAGYEVVLVDSFPRDTDTTAPAAAVEAFLEDKYDGIRAQVHCGDAAQPDRVAIYSRSREDVTESFPELAEAFAAVTEPLILDGEILGWDFAADAGAEGPRALPFAVLGQRIGRKRVSNKMRRAVPVVFMAFDLMFAGGELLLEFPLRERRNRLEAVADRLVGKTVSPLEANLKAASSQQQAVLFAHATTGEAGAQETHLPRLMISPSRLIESAEDIDRAYAEARARANEGVMLKAAGSIYQPGRRGLAWVKLKRELATLDVVVTGAEFGHGRRAGILSDYTFAVRGVDGELLNVGKAYSGLTDAEITEMSAWMMAHTLEDHGHFRTVEPLMVLEVAFNNIMRSSRHASGFAMRFPRILRIRTDKAAEEIDTVERVEEVYQSQVDKPAEKEDSDDATLS